MGERVAIVAVAQTKYAESKPEQSIEELIEEASDKVLQETGLHYRDDGTGIDVRVVACQDHLDNKLGSHYSPFLIMGSYRRHSEKIAGDGALAVYAAALGILGGHYGVAIVESHCKESQLYSKNYVENWGLEPVYQQAIGLDYLSAAALQAKRYMDKWGASSEDCAKVVVKNRGNAKNNPYAQSPADLTVEDVLSSRMLAYPIRQLDAKPTSDGACVMVLANEERAKKLTAKPVWIKGMANCYDHHYLGDRDLGNCDALVGAAQRAYRMAGITNPRREIDLAEISEQYSYQELLWTEGLGFCEPGKGKGLLNKGMTEMGGKIPVNPSGGLLSGVPLIVAGISRVAEAVLQLRGEAGARQVEGAKVALAHGVHGCCGQQHCVLILEK